MPTDAEWQYACKAGLTGSRYGEIRDIVWYSENSEGRIHEVGKKEPNRWGLYDMLGNAWEWCWDLYDEKTYGPYRIFRGGSWAESARGWELHLLINPVFTWKEALLQLEQRVSTIHEAKGQFATIFVTTGSHQLESIVQSSFTLYSRLLVRVLPEGFLVKKCQDMGIPPRDIVANNLILRQNNTTNFCYIWRYN